MSVDQGDSCSLAKKIGDQYPVPIKDREFSTSVVDGCNSIGKKNCEIFVSCGGSEAILTRTKTGPHYNDEGTLEMLYQKEDNDETAALKNADVEEVTTLILETRVDSNEIDIAVNKKEQLKLDVIANRTAKHSDKNHKENNSLLKKTTLRQKLTLLFITVATFSIYFCISLPGTFMARIVLDRGGTTLYATAVMQANQVAAAIASLVCAKFQYHIGCKRSLIFGLFVFAVCQASNSFLQHIRDMTAFVTFGILVRIVLGVSQGFFNVASLTLLWQVLPDYIEKAYGISLSSMGTGYLAGPVVGSLLYSIRGEMMIPFLASAAIPALLSIIGYLYLRETVVSRDQSGIRILKYIMKPWTILVIGIQSAMFGTISLYDVTFTTYMESMGFTVLQVGSVMLVGDVVFTTGSITGGYIASVGKTARLFLLVVAVLGLLGILFAFVVDQSIGWIYLETCVFTLFCAFVTTAAFAQAMHLAVGEQEELMTNFQFQSKFSGTWFFISNFAAVLYPLLGSSLQSLLSYRFSLVICDVSATTIGIIASSSIYLTLKYRSKREPAEAKL